MISTLGDARITAAPAALAARPILMRSRFGLDVHQSDDVRARQSEAVTKPQT